jgi:ribA/ribD-fused uncharacterized protein
METKKYTFFWKDKDVFSQWHRVGFTVDGVHFKTAEHWMMWKKAMMFGDALKAEEILQTKEARDVKQKGREVSGFNKYEWEQNCKRFVYDGNHAKFTQNPALLKELMDTGDTLLVEASPFDMIWGIGLKEEDAKNTPEEKWPGTNWLGEILTELRENLKQQSKNQ